MSNSCSCHGYNEGEKDSKIELILTIIGIVLFIAAIFLKNVNQSLSLISFVLSYIFIGYEVIFSAFKRLLKKDMFDENFLMMLATFGAFAIGEYAEGVAVILLYKIGELLQEKAVENSKRKISAAVDIRVNEANLKVKDKITKVKAESLKVGDIIIVKTGEKIPVDGMLLSDGCQLDMSALSGESKPISLKKNQQVLSGSINIGSVIEIEVTKTFENSTVYRIIELIENSNQKKSTTEKFITRFARIYTPIVTVIAVLIALLPVITNITYIDSLHRAFTFLVISCPCALVISVPLGFFVGIGASSKKGVLIKGSNYLDILTDVDTIVFDKTGTLTKGVFEVTKINSYGNLKENEVIEKIAICEQFSNHYIARSILNYYNKEVTTKDIISHEEIPGKGIKVKFNDEDILVGNYSLMEENNIKIEETEECGTIIYLAINNTCEGYIILSDVLKEDTKDLIRKLNAVGITEIIVLTGDNKDIAENISNKIGINKVYAELLPEDKAKVFEKIKYENKNRKVAYVGDGINDSPVLALADVGISMGKGSDLAIETSDIVIMGDEPSKVVYVINIAKKTKKIIKENIYFAISIKVLFLILSSFGLMSMWFAIFADVGVALITVVNSIRIFKNK